MADQFPAPSERIAEGTDAWRKANGLPIATENKAAPNVAPSESKARMIRDSKGGIILQLNEAGGTVVDNRTAQTDAYAGGAYAAGRPGTGPSDRYP